jgi:hypothetical protein
MIPGSWIGKDEKDGVLAVSYRSLEILRKTM